MPDDEAKKTRGGILGILGLSPIALLVVAGLTLIVWFYYNSVGERLTTGETAAVLLGVAVLTAICLLLLRLLRRVLAGRKVDDTKAPP